VVAFSAPGGGKKATPNDSSEPTSDSVSQLIQSLKELVLSRHSGCSVVTEDWRNEYAPYELLQITFAEEFLGSDDCYGAIGKSGLRSEEGRQTFPYLTLTAKC
jgi:hypothetical protein